MVETVEVEESAVEDIKISYGGNEKSVLDPAPMPLSTGASQLRDMRIRANKLLRKLLKASPAAKAELQLRFTLRETELLCQRKSDTLRKAEESGVIEPVEKNPKTNRRLGYTHSQVYKLMTHFKTLPWRDPSQDKCIYLAVANFKGGVSKTETTSNFARYLAIKGYRVLVVDLDYQGSCTRSFGFLPEEDFTVEDTIVPYMVEEQPTLHGSIQETHWDNIQLIPANSHLEDFQFAFNYQAQSLKPEEVQERKNLFEKLRGGFDTVQEGYDVILIDCPPSTSVMSLSIIASADGLVVPVPPLVHDISSTTQFLATAEKLLENVLTDKTFKFYKFLITRYSGTVKDANRDDDNYTFDQEFYEILLDTFGSRVYPKVFRNMSIIKESSALYMSAYEYPDPNKKLLRELDATFRQIEIDILKCWPSKKAYINSLGI